MRQIKNYIINADKKKMHSLQLLFTIIMLFVHFYTKQKFKNGYEFFISFLSILPVDIFMVATLFRSVFELDGPPRNPFYLMKYPTYFMIVIFASAPFLYLWGMWDVILNLKW